MIRRENDCCVFKLACHFERVDQLAEQIINIGYVCEIAMTSRADVGFGYGVIAHCRYIKEPLAVSIEFFTGHVWHGGQGDFVVLIQVPKLFARCIGIMRMREAGQQSERLFGREARIVVKLACGLKRHIIIKFKLV